MADFNTHLAIAKLYAKRVGTIKDLNAFYKASIDPDLTHDKTTTHYGYDPGPSEMNAWKSFGPKVGLSKFLQHHSLDTDYNLGHFLHLVTDIKFFHEFIGEEYLSKQNTDIFKANIYHTYSVINPYIIDKYSLDTIGIEKIMDVSPMKESIEKVHNKIAQVNREMGHEPVCIIDTVKLDEFILEVANVDLESIAEHARISFRG